MDGHLDISGPEVAGQNLDGELRPMLLRVASAGLADKAVAISADERSRRADGVMDLVRRLRDQAAEPGGSDHSWLYGDDGLPK